MSKNHEVLQDFIQYCTDHPDERFYQALRNWMHVPFILVANYKDLDTDDFKGIQDTFYKEGK